MTATTIGLIAYIKAYAAKATQLADLTYGRGWAELGVTLADALTYAANGYTPAEIKALRDRCAADSTDYAARDDLTEAVMTVEVCNTCNTIGRITFGAFDHNSMAAPLCPAMNASSTRMTYLAWRANDMAVA